jgi:GNAT superfamily N-acetyltransferase
MSSNSNKITIKLVENDEDLASCYPVMRQLRPALSLKEFISRVKRQNSLYQYHNAFLKDGDEVITVVGFRIAENLGYGKFLFVDEFVTSEEKRAKTYGKRMFEWLVAYAKSIDCNEIQLDAGVQRFDAHRFYFKNRMRITSYHFILNFRDI